MRIFDGIAVSDPQRTPLKGSDDARRVSGDDHIGRHRLGDDGARSDDGVLPHGDAGEDDRPASQPGVLLDHDRLRRFPFGSTQFGVERMRRRQQLHVRTDLHVVADRDRRDV